MSEESEPSSNRNLLIVGALVLLGILRVAGATFFSSGSASVTQVPVETPAPVVPTPAVETAPTTVVDPATSPVEVAPVTPVTPVVVSAVTTPAPVAPATK